MSLKYSLTPLYTQLPQALPRGVVRRRLLPSLVAVLTSNPLSMPSMGPHHVSRSHKASSGSSQNTNIPVLPPYYLSPGHHHILLAIPFHLLYNNNNATSNHFHVIGPQHHPTLMVPRVLRKGYKIGKMIVRFYV